MADIIWNMDNLEGDKVNLVYANMSSLASCHSVKHLTLGKKEGRESLLPMLRMLPSHPLEPLDGHGFDSLIRI